MELIEEYYKHIAPVLLVQRGNMCIPSPQILNAILYVAEHSCKWREVPPFSGLGIPYTSV